MGDRQVMPTPRKWATCSHYWNINTVFFLFCKTVLISQKRLLFVISARVYQLHTSLSLPSYLTFPTMEVESASHVPFEDEDDALPNMVRKL